MDWWTYLSGSSLLAAYIGGTKPIARIPKGTQGNSMTYLERNGTHIQYVQL